MRFLCFLFLIAFAGAVGLFVWQNQQELTVSFWEWDVTARISEVVLVAFVLGMLSGWTVVGMLRRSIYTVTDYSRRAPLGW